MDIGSHGDNVNSQTHIDDTNLIDKGIAAKKTAEGLEIRGKVIGEITDKGNEFEATIKWSIKEGKDGKDTETIETINLSDDFPKENTDVRRQMAALKVILYLAAGRMKIMQEKGGLVGNKLEPDVGLLATGTFKIVPGPKPSSEIPRKIIILSKHEGTEVTREIDLSSLKVQNAMKGLAVIQSPIQKSPEDSLKDFDDLVEKVNALANIRLKSTSSSKAAESGTPIDNKKADLIRILENYFSLSEPKRVMPVNRGDERGIHLLRREVGEDIQRFMGAYEAACQLGNLQLMQRMYDKFRRLSNEMNGWKRDYPNINFNLQELYQLLSQTMGLKKTIKGEERGLKAAENFIKILEVRIQETDVEGALLSKYEKAFKEKNLKSFLDEVRNEGAQFSPEAIKKFKALSEKFLKELKEDKGNIPISQGAINRKATRADFPSIEASTRKEISAFLVYLDRLPQMKTPFTRQHSVSIDSSKASQKLTLTFRNMDINGNLRRERSQTTLISPAPPPQPERDITPLKPYQQKFNFGEFVNACQKKPYDLIKISDLLQKVIKNFSARERLDPEVRNTLVKLITDLKKNLSTKEYSPATLQKIGEVMGFSSLLLKKGNYKDTPDFSLSATFHHIAIRALSSDVAFQILLGMLSINNQEARSLFNAFWSTINQVKQTELDYFRMQGDFRQQLSLSGEKVTEAPMQARLERKLNEWVSNKILLPLSNGQIPGSKNIEIFNNLLSGETVPKEFPLKKETFFNAIIKCSENRKFDKEFQDFLAQVVSWEWAKEFLNKKENQLIKDQINLALGNPVLLHNIQVDRLSKGAAIAIKLMENFHERTVIEIQEKLYRFDELLEIRPFPTNLIKDIAKALANRFLTEKNFDLRFYYELEKGKFWNEFKKLDPGFVNRIINIKSRVEIETLHALHKLDSTSTETASSKDEMQKANFMNMAAIMFRAKSERVQRLEINFYKDSEQIRKALEEIFEDPVKIRELYELKKEQEVKEFFRKNLMRFKENSNFEDIVNYSFILTKINNTIKNAIDNIGIFFDPTSQKSKQEKIEAMNKFKELDIASRILKSVFLKKTFSELKPEAARYFISWVQVQNYQVDMEKFSKHIDNRRDILPFVGKDNFTYEKFYEGINSQDQEVMGELGSLRKHQGKFLLIELFTHLQIINQLQIKSMEISSFQSIEILRTELEKTVLHEKELSYRQAYADLGNEKSQFQLALELDLMSAFSVSVSAKAVPVPAKITIDDDVAGIIREASRELPEHFDMLAKRTSKLLVGKYEELARDVRRFRDIKPIALTLITTRGKKGEPEKLLNANLVGHAQNAHIAAQTPEKASEFAFWRLCLDKSEGGKVGVSVIVDLTNKRDETRTDQPPSNVYYPKAKQPITYDGGNFIVRCAEDKEGNEVVKEITLRSGKKIIEHTYIIEDHTDPANVKTRTMTRINYPDWPDYGVADMTDMMDLNDHLNAYLEAHKDKINPGVDVPLVCCRAGVGRTGTFITLRTLLLGDEQFSKSIKDLAKEIRDNKDVKQQPPATILKNNMKKVQEIVDAMIIELRKQRGEIFVQSEEQYIEIVKLAMQLLKNELWPKV